MENFIEKDAQEVFEQDFLDFAGYNLQRRALPDARDGLKWGARKLIHAQMLGKLTYDKPFKKAIKSVSQAMSFSYTHGDASAYGTFIRMAKPFACRVPLQEANGNFGTLINPDDHSASRYVELRGSKLAAKLLEDLEKETITEWEDTYDMEGKFPKVLPAKGFWNGVNGCISIGSGMASSLPPLNLIETNEAMIKLLWNPDIADEEIICLPDFPTGATLLNQDAVIESLKNGNGFAAKVRASVAWDSKERCFIVTEMPYSTYTNTICKELAAIMADEENNCGITDFQDYTGTSPDLRIYLSKVANPDKVLKYLYKNTSLETHFSINMTVLDRGIMPVVMGQKQLFQAHLDHEKEVYTRGYEFDKRKIEYRLHILDGLLIALAKIDEVVHTIKTSTSTAAANKALQQNFLLDEDQAKAILDMKLSRLAHLEVEKLEKEKEDLIIKRDAIAAILNDEVLLKKEIEKGLREVATKFGDTRRTKIINIVKEDEEPTEIRQLQVSLTNFGNIFATEVSSLYTQRRGGVGNKIKMADGEYVIATQPVNSNEELLFFSHAGNVYHYKVANIAIEQFLHVQQLAPVKDWERVCAITSAHKKTDKPYILFFTKKGMVKKSEMSEYNVTRNVGLKALTLDEGDEIVNVLFTDNEKVGIVTEGGNFLMIATEDIRPIGRVAKGVKAIKLNDGDGVASARIIPADTTMIASISGNGLFKKTDIEEFVVQGRGTKGAKIQKLNDGDWMADFYPIVKDGEILVASTNACIKLTTNDIPIFSKGAMGNKSIKLNAKDNVVGISIY